MPPTDEEVAAELTRKCMHGDLEIAHVEADCILTDLLKKLGYEKTVAAYERVGKWYA